MAKSSDHLWAPTPETIAGTNIGRFVAWLEARGSGPFPSYADLWEWSVADVAGFWAAVWEFFDVQAGVPYSAVLEFAGDAGQQVVPRRPAELRRAHPASSRRHAGDHRPLAVPSTVVIDVGSTGRSGRASPNRSGSDWVSAAAIEWPRTCRTCRRRSSHSWRLPASVRSGPVARPSSACRRCSTVSARSIPRCCWSSTAIATGHATSTVASRCKRSATVC